MNAAVATAVTYYWSFSATGNQSPEPWGDSVWSTGGAYNLSYPSYSDAYFQGSTGGSVTLNNGDWAGNVTFATDGYSIDNKANNSGQAFLSIGDGGIINTMTGTSTISVVLTGAGASGWTKSGSGTLALTGNYANTYTGTVTVSGGGLYLNKSSRQRDYLGGGERSLLPPHLEQLRNAQIPTEPLCDRDLPTFTLGPHDAVIAEGTACLSDREVRAFVDWIKCGGTLLATSDAGTCDEAGRKRPSSLLADLLGTTPNGTHLVDSGRVLWLAVGSDFAKALKRCVKPVVQIEPRDPGWEVTTYWQRHPERFWVHVIGHSGTPAKSSYLLLQLPEGIKIVRAAIWTDLGEQEAQSVQEGSRLRVSLPVGVPYLIVRLCSQ